MIDDLKLLGMIKAIVDAQPADGPGVVLLPLEPMTAMTMLRCVFITQQTLKHTTADTDLTDVLTDVLRAKTLLQDLLDVDADEMFQLEEEDVN